jgi:hypothetical protein
MLLATERGIRAEVAGSDFDAAVKSAQAALEGERFRRFIHEPHCPSCRVIVEAREIPQE